MRDRDPVMEAPKVLPSVELRLREEPMRVLTLRVGEGDARPSLSLAVSLFWEGFVLMLLVFVDLLTWGEMNC